MVVLEAGNFLHDYVVTKLQCFDGQYCPQMDCHSALFEEATFSMKGVGASDKSLFEIGVPKIPLSASLARFVIFFSRINFAI